MMLLRQSQIRRLPASSRLLLQGIRSVPSRPGVGVVNRFISTSTIPSAPSPGTPTESPTIAHDHAGGHISTNDDEALFFINNTFFFPVSWAPALEWVTPAQFKAEELVRPSVGSDWWGVAREVVGGCEGVTVREVVPRFKDGGVFVKVGLAGWDVKKLTETIQARLREKPVRTWHSPIRGVSLNLVKGLPWLEDLRRYPARRLKIEFVPVTPGGPAAELSQENLFSLFRRYGKISEIVSQPYDSGVKPRYALVDFRSLDDAIMARTCLHGITVPAELGGGEEGTKLRLGYEGNVRVKNIWGWLSSHPKIVIPLLAALLATVTVAVFDPMRQFFVRMHIQHSFDLNQNALYAWFKNRTVDLLEFAGVSDKSALDAVYVHQQALVDQVRDWTKENTETFVVVHGPRGSGKAELVKKQALAGRRNVLVVDCKTIVEARGESQALSQLASAVGYRPLFGWAINLSSLLDLAIQGTTGVKSSFSESFEAQISRILHTTLIALKQASSADYTNHPNQSTSQDAFLEAHPERRSVIVIDNFLHNSDENTLFYEKLTEWAALAVQSNAAHVIFLTSDASYSKELARVLPDRAVNQIALGDLPRNVARNFVLSRIRAGVDDATIDAVDEEAKKAAVRKARQRIRNLDHAALDRALQTLGGRVTDLEAFSRRINSGAAPEEALEDMTSQLATDIVRMYLTPRPGSRPWTPEQAWVIISGLAARESLRYEEVMISGLFFGDSISSAAAIDALAAQEVVSVKLQGGRPRSIHPGSPALRAAFEAVCKDPVLSGRLELNMLLELVKVETAKITKAEQEFIQLGMVAKQPWQVGGRVKYLMGKIELSQGKVDEYEARIADLKKVLSVSD